MAKELSIQAEVAAVRPNCSGLATTLLDEIRTFFQDPKMEAEFQAWKKERDKGKDP